MFSFVALALLECIPCLGAGSATLRHAEKALEGALV